jgi:hypothetical protein
MKRLEKIGRMGYMMYNKEVIEVQAFGCFMGTRIRKKH